MRRKPGQVGRRGSPAPLPAAAPRRLVAALAAALLLVSPGCLTPFRAHVDPDVLTRDLPWEEAYGPSTGSWNGPKYVETDYTFKGSGSPPYTAVLQVFSVREFGRRSTEELLDLTRDLVAQGAEAKGIRIDAAASRDGTRTLRNGLQTHWFSQEGTVASTGPLFQQQNVRVLILGEVGYDGRSSTMVVAVGIAQVESTQCTPLLPACQTQRDTRSWDSLAGDAKGTIRDARSDHGLVDHLVTHG